MLTPDEVVLVVVDVQGKLADLVVERGSLMENLSKAIRGAKVMGIPIIWVEQNPRGLGPTVPQIQELLSGLEPISKMSFSCCGSEEFLRRLRPFGRRTVLLSGIETHVCIYQTAADLLERGYSVEVLVDAVSSRRRTDKEIALDRIRSLGGGLTTVESVLFELLRVAEGERFRQIHRIVK